MPPPGKRNLPRLLIVDDDPVSLHFLAEVARGSHCDVVAVPNAAAALAAAHASPLDLLLLDRRLPDMSGAELLARLRAASVTAPAIATSAEVDAGVDAMLRAAGFVAVLSKPLAVEKLRAQLHAWLPGDGGVATLQLLDDASASAVSGSAAETLRALRGLFVTELTELERHLADDACVVDAERLHRLRASCGFCGAAALGDIAAQLERALRSNAPRFETSDVRALRQELQRVCSATRAALLQSAPGVAANIAQARSGAPSR